MKNSYVYVALVDYELSRVFWSFDDALAWVKSFGAEKHNVISQKDCVWYGELLKNCEIGSAYAEVIIRPEKVYS